MSGPGRLASIITAADPALRDRSIDELCRGAPAEHLLAEAADLERFRRRSDNLYHRVRALFFLYAIHRFYLPPRLVALRRWRQPPRADPLRRLHPPPAATLRGGHRRLPGRPGPSGAVRRPLQRPRRHLPRAGLSDPGRPGPAQRARGAGEPVDVPHRAPHGPAPAPAPGAAAPLPGGSVPPPARGHPRAHGPHPQRLERHLLPGHGLPRGGAGAQRLHRPRRARGRGGPGGAPGPRWRPSCA